MAVKYLSGLRLTGTGAERLALSGNNLDAIAQTSWKEIGRSTLTSAGDTLDTGTIVAKDNLLILVIGHKNGTGGQIERLRFNADDGDNYTKRYAENGGNDSTTDHDYIELGVDSEDSEFGVIYVRNTASKEKLLSGHCMARGSTGSGAIGNRLEVVGKWNRTSGSGTGDASDRITKVQVLDKADQMGNSKLDTGSELVVLGCDDDEADSGTNFWQELASVDITSGDNHTTGTFTAKKWLMFTTTVVTTGGAVSQRTTFNDTTSGYAQRKCFDGGSENTSLNSANLDGLNDDLVTNSIGFTTYFMYNETSKEKLGIGHAISGEATGAGTAPTRDEETFKWIGSAQIVKIDFDNNKSGDWTTGSNIRVWGSD